MMEWVETTARTVDEAKELALDQLGVVEDEADFEVLAEPKQGLFGRIRGEARVRARVRPTPVRPKQDRRRGRRGAETASAGDAEGTDAPAEAGDGQAAGAASPPNSGDGGRRRTSGRGRARPTDATTPPLDRPHTSVGAAMTNDANQDPSTDEGTDGPVSDPADV